MRGAAWAGFVVVVIGAAYVPTLDHGPSSSLPALARLWWAFPLAVSVVSFASLLGFSFAGRRNGMKSGFPTSAYLASGPSLAGLNLFTFLSLGAPPPFWVGSAMLFLLCLSSLVYYRITKRSDEDTQPFAMNDRSFSSPSV